MMFNEVDQDMEEQVVP
ncbi:hypothetical protein RDI58_020569 [Solanum bulbocastanum]|uniref:Uncharacterized protein n=1 Tax=Solanum bulbocastanum TaxID=147425 RepID=A0AAN8YAT5_SOLBU